MIARPSVAAVPSDFLGPSLSPSTNSRKPSKSR